MCWRVIPKTGECDSIERGSESGKKDGQMPILSFVQCCKSVARQKRPPRNGVAVFAREELRSGLEVLTAVIAQSEHVASLRDAAECLYMTDRTREALAFIERAKQVESGNPFVLDLEARIHEGMGNLNQAYDALFLAMIRNPKNWGFHHRLGRLKVAQGFPEAALDHSEGLKRRIPINSPPSHPSSPHCWTLTLPKK